MFVLLNNILPSYSTEVIRFKHLSSLLVKVLAVNLCQNDGILKCCNRVPWMLFKYKYVYKLNILFSEFRN